MNLAKMLKETGVRQQDLADALGVSRTTVTNYVNGKRDPDLQTLARIADFFHVSLDYLADRETVEEPRTTCPVVEIYGRQITLDDSAPVRIHVNGAVINISVEAER